MRLQASISGGTPGYDGWSREAFRSLYAGSEAIQVRSTVYCKALSTYTVESSGSAVRAGKKHEAALV